MQGRLNCFKQIQVPLVASNRVGKELIHTEHGKSEITFYGNSFIAGTPSAFLLHSEW